MRDAGEWIDRHTSAADRLHNLPLRLTSFVGRERELAAVRQRLGGHRLITLTGPGGSGKSRSALEVAWSELGRYHDGVWLVELASVAQPELVPQAVAKLLGVEEKSDASFQTALTGYLRARRMVLLLDNCEHLVEACASLVDMLLRSCPGLTILATSREPLHLDGEVIWQVPPLSTPAGPTATNARDLLDYDAVQLFVQRARDAQPGFVLSDANASAVAAICTRLDGMPLAIELAAARVQSLHVDDIAARLEHRFSLLTRGSRVAPPRHQTLHALLDWSYELLSAPERALLDRLSVFAGGFDLVAVETVCISPGMDAQTVIDLLLRLVDKSLVVSDAHHEVGRFRLLETVRQYATERLAASGELDAIAEQHAVYFLNRAEAADAALRGSSSVTSYVWLERERENLRAGLHWFIAGEQGRSALRLAAALGWFWYVRGYLSEARTTFAIVLDLPGATERTPLRSRACFCAAAATWFLGDYSAAMSLAHQALSIGREVGALQQIGQALCMQAALTSDRGHLVEARMLLDESLAACQRANDGWSASLALYWLGVVISEEGDTTQARAVHEQALAMRRAIGDGWAVGASLGRLAELAAQLGDGPATHTYADEALGIARQLGNRRGVARNLWYLGVAALGQGDRVAAEESFRESLAIWLEIRERGFIPRALEGAAAIAAVRRDAATAVQLAGGAAGLREQIGTVATPVERAQIDRWQGAARARLGQRAALAWERGRIMTVEAAVELARKALSAAHPSQGYPEDGRPVLGGDSRLTAREREIVVHIARGFTNRQIADALVISERTVEVHVGHIRDKLGLASRPRIAVWAVGNGLVDARA